MGPGGQPVEVEFTADDLMESEVTLIEAHQDLPAETRGIIVAMEEATEGIINEDDVPDQISGNDTATILVPDMNHQRFEVPLTILRLVNGPWAAFFKSSEED